MFSVADNLFAGYLIMPDKLDWLNKHFVLLKHKTVQETADTSHYKIPFEQRELAQNNPQAEDYIRALAQKGCYPEASEFLAYNIHQRALAWWAYCCVLSLQKELLQVPHKPRDISEIGVRKKPEIPDWAKMPQDQPVDYKSDPEYIRLQSELGNIKVSTEKLIERLPPGLWEEHLALRKRLYGEFKKVVGMDPDELMTYALDQVKKVNAQKEACENSAPVYKMREELEAKIEKIRQGTISRIKEALPKKSPAELREQAENAMDAVYACITAPTEKNAADCLNAGNACPEIPEGLAALVSFWCYGNLTPNVDRVIKTPPELAPNGMKGLLLKCALTPGGTRGFRERTRLYFEIGKEVVFGHNNWTEFMKNENPPHRRLNLDAFDGYLGDKAPVKAEEAPAGEEASAQKPPVSEPKKFERFKG